MKITFKFAEGQLVKLQEDRPEEAYALTDVPTEFLREYVASYFNDDDGHSFGDERDVMPVAEFDHRTLLQLTLAEYQEALCAELNMYCDAQELPHLSADEILLARRLTDEQRAYLTDYIDRWDDMVGLYYVCQRG